MSWSPGGPGGPRGPRGPQGPRPPDLEDLLDQALRRGRAKLRQLFPGGIGGSRAILVIVLVLAGLWLLTGFYRVNPDEQGIVLRFGAWDGETQPPGLRYHLPVPIETAYTPRVTRETRVEIGFRTDERRGGQSRPVPDESLMLTGDENIVDVNFTVVWVIKDAGAFLFNVRHPESTVKKAAESAMREIIGRSPIALALSEGRGQIEQSAEDLLQEMLDSYGAGILIRRLQLQRVDPPQPVIEAFRDVQRARADMVRLRNEAEAYRNDIVPRARGQAEEILQQAEGYKREVVARSEGDAQRFVSIYEAYRQARDVTTRRIYLETLEAVLRGTKNKILIDRAAEGGQGVVPYLALPEVDRRRTRASDGGTVEAGR